MEEKFIVSKSVHEVVREFNNDQLISLLKEIREISNRYAPALGGYSEDMTNLFNIEKQFGSRNWWSEQFSNISLHVEREVLNRIVKNQIVINNA